MLINATLKFPKLLKYAWATRQTREKPRYNLKAFIPTLLIYFQTKLNSLRLPKVSSQSNMKALYRVFKTVTMKNVNNFLNVIYCYVENEYPGNGSNTVNTKLWGRKYHKSSKRFATLTYLLAGYNSSKSPLNFLQ